MGDISAATAAAGSDMHMRDVKAALTRISPHLTLVRNPAHLATLLDASNVHVRGWIRRKHVVRKRSFLDIHFGNCHKVQVVVSARKDDGAEGVDNYQQVISTQLDSYVSIVGTVCKTPKGNFELNAEHFIVISSCQEEGGIQSIINKEIENPKPETLSKHRGFALRYSKHNMWLRLLTIIIKSCRQFCEDVEEMTQVFPPCMVSYTSEGGADCFSFVYNSSDDKEAATKDGDKQTEKKETIAYLTQSSQLYLEAAVPSLGNCFCIMPSFRAEKSRTVRHLSEYTHFEAELAFTDLDGLSNHLEAMVKYVHKNVVASGILTEIEALGFTIPIYGPNKEEIISPDVPFVRMTYYEYLQKVKKAGFTKEDGTEFTMADDVPSSIERKFIDQFGKPVFLTQFPKDLKAFYMLRNHQKAEDGKTTTTHSLDLLVPGCGEIVGGSCREVDHAALVEGVCREVPDDAEDCEKKRQCYDFYTDLRKFGPCYSAGYGLGASRLAMMYGCPNIQLATLFPRTIDKLYP